MSAAARPTRAEYIAEWVAQAMETAPPLTDEQAEHLAWLLRGGDR